MSELQNLILLLRPKEILYVTVRDRRLSRRRFP